MFLFRFQNFILFIFVVISFSPVENIIAREIPISFPTKKNLFSFYFYLSKLRSFSQLHKRVFHGYILKLERYDTGRIITHTFNKFLRKPLFEPYKFLVKKLTCASVPVTFSDAKDVELSFW